MSTGYFSSRPHCDRERDLRKFSSIVIEFVKVYTPEGIDVRFNTLKKTSVSKKFIRISEVVDMST